MKQSFVKIGAKKYSVLKKTSETEQVFKDNPDARSFIDYDNSRIVLRPLDCSTTMKENLVHEILHGLFENSGVDSDDYERIIKILTPRLCALFADNKELIRYLTEED